MQAAGTLRGTRVISLLVLLVPLIGCAYSAPLQYLPSIPGYVPVYIRYGDEPLEDINPQLAEAFGETSNSAKVDRTLDHASDNFKDNDIDALLEEESTESHAYPLRVRATDNRSFASVNDNNQGRNSNKPKLLTIYQLPDDDDSRRGRRRNRSRGRNRTRGNRRRLPLKVSPLSDEEKEELEKLAMEVEKEETKPNEYALGSKPSELPRATNRNRHKSHRFSAPVKVQNPLDESSLDLQDISRAADLPKSSNNRHAGRSKARTDKNETTGTPRTGKKEGPIKLQPPATFLSNVNKLSSPIHLPDNNTTEKDKARNPTEANNDEVAME